MSGAAPLSESLQQAVTGRLAKKGGKTLMLQGWGMTGLSSFSLISLDTELTFDCNRNHLGRTAPRPPRLRAGHLWQAAHFDGSSSRRCRWEGRQGGRSW